MPARLVSPHTFRERLLLFGIGGTGKTTAVLSIARQLAVGHMFVLDNDYSFAYTRALETEFADCADRVTVVECEPTWTEMTAALAKVVELAEARDDAADCWVVIDSISPSWEFVQSHITEQITGASSAEYLTQLRRESNTLSDMQKQLVDQVPWNIVKREYAEGIYIPIRSWKGHLILTAEAKKLGRGDLDKAEIADFYQHLGVQPAGESRIHYVTSTTLLMSKGKRGEYRMTTVKDRQRVELENEPIDDFAMDYLREVAGWQVKVIRDAPTDTPTRAQEKDT